MKHIFLSIFALLPLAVSATDLSSPDGKYTQKPLDKGLASARDKNGLRVLCEKFGND